MPENHRGAEPGRVRRLKGVGDFFYSLFIALQHDCIGKDFF